MSQRSIPLRERERFIMFFLQGDTLEQAAQKSGLNSGYTHLSTNISSLQGENFLRNAE
jgi:hypothetical protein